MTRSRLDRLAGSMYLGLLVADGYPEQEPEYELARWYDLLWVCIPILGFFIFLECISARKRK